MKSGVPVVATPLAVEGMHATDSRDCLLATGPRQFAAAVVSAYTDCPLWKRLVTGGHANMAAHFSMEAATPALLQVRVGQVGGQAGGRAGESGLCGAVVAGAGERICWQACLVLADLLLCTKHSHLPCAGLQLGGCWPHAPPAAWQLQGCGAGNGSAGRGRSELSLRRRDHDFYRLGGVMLGDAWNSRALVLLILFFQIVNARQHRLSF